MSILFFLKMNPTGFCIRLEIIIRNPAEFGIYSKMNNEFESIQYS